MPGMRLSGEEIAANDILARHHSSLDNYKQVMYLSIRVVFQLLDSGYATHTCS